MVLVQRTEDALKIVEELAQLDPQVEKKFVTSRRYEGCEWVRYSDRPVSILDVKCEIHGLRHGYRPFEIMVEEV